MPKAPQDRKPKKSAVDKLRAEAKKSVVDDLAGRELTIQGRRGTVAVTTLADPLDWDAEVMAFLRDGDYMSAILGMLSDEDGAQLRAIRPSIANVMNVVMGDDEDEGDASEPSLGESQAS